MECYRLFEDMYISEILLCNKSPNTQKNKHMLCLTILQVTWVVLLVWASLAGLCSQQAAWLGPRGLGWPPSHVLRLSCWPVWGPRQQMVHLCSMWSSHPQQASQRFFRWHSWGSTVQQERASKPQWVSTFQVCPCPSGQIRVSMERDYPRVDVGKQE